MGWVDISKQFSAPSVGGTVSTGGLANGPWSINFGSGSASATAENTLVPKVGPVVWLAIGVGVLWWMKHKKA
jgi:hypothetical protein